MPTRAEGGPAVSAGDPARPPATDAPVSLEGLFGAALPTVVTEATAGGVRLDAPRMAGHAIPLPLDRPFTVAYRLRGAFCEVPAVLVAAPDPGRPDYEAAFTGPAVRLRRRKAVRIPADLGVLVTPRPPREGAGRALAVHGRTLDVSGIGVLAILTEALGLGIACDLVLNLEAAGLVHATADVVRCAQGERGRWEVALALRHVALPDRRRFARFLVDRHRLLRRRELGQV